MTRTLASAALLLALATPGAAHAQPAPAAPAPAATASAPGAGAQRLHIRPVDDAWRHDLPRDAEAATQAYMDRLSPEAVARADAYFEGGYWLQLWNWVIGLVVTWLVLRRGTAARVRDWAQRVGRWRIVGDALFGACWGLASSVLTFPFDLYVGLIREQRYGMATQTFGPWFGEHLVQVGLGALFTGLAVALLYAVFRRTGERWWMWGTGVGIAMLVVVLMIFPVWVDPLFNTYKPVADPAVRDAVLQMARADGVPVDNVYEFDASRQTTRVSANVTGIFGSASVRLNDNLLRTSLPEIRAVMGHELGHFVMNHIYKSIAEITLVLFAGFAFAQWAMRALLRRHGAAWRLAGLTDAASFPLLMAVLSTFFLLATPVMNTLTRTQEIEADRFGLNLARDPLAEAEVDLKLTEYRKPDPGPIEEFVFFDHPSTRFRIHDAMRWRQAMGTP